MDDDAKALAARDMNDIRARRAAGQGNTQGKVKYKKRSVSAVPTLISGPTSSNVLSTARLAPRTMSVV
jgi:hypothetical protein